MRKEVVGGDNFGPGPELPAGIDLNWSIYGRPCRVFARPGPRGTSGYRFSYRPSMENLERIQWEALHERGNSGRAGDTDVFVCAQVP